MFYKRKSLSGASPVLLSVSSNVDFSHIEEKKGDRLPDPTLSKPLTQPGPDNAGGRRSKRF